MVAADLYTLTYGLATTGQQSRQTIASIQAAMKAEAETKAKESNGHSNGTIVEEKSEPVSVTVEA